MAWNELFTRGGLIVTFIAFGIAVWQTWAARSQLKEARKQTEELRNVIGEINQVKLSLSTRYLGAFPEFITNIIELIKEAKSEIIICCEFPTYGFYSAHRYWRAYRSALEDRMVDGIVVELIIPSSSERKSLNDKDFEFDEDEWRQWKITEKKEAIEDLLGITRENTSVDKLQKQRFVELVEVADQYVLQDTFRRARVIEIIFHSPISFFIIDGKRAIFSFSSTGLLRARGIISPHNITEKATTSYGFATSDQGFIRALLELRDRYKLGAIITGS